MNSTDNLKARLREVRGTPLSVPGSHPKYKELFSDTVWDLMDQVIDERDRQAQVIRTMEGTAKMVVNQTQLLINEVRRLGQAQQATTDRLKLARANGEEASLFDDPEVDLQGQ